MTNDSTAKEPLFLKQINMLQSSSGNGSACKFFDAFPNYMHTERPIKKIREAIEELEHQPKKQLILLAGSV